MNCVFNAYINHLHWLGENAKCSDRIVWITLKWYTHGSKPQYTFGGVVPWILTKLAARHRLSVRGEYRVYSPTHHLRASEFAYPKYYKRHRAIIAASDFGVEVEKFTLAPAIYLSLSTEHALFALDIPTDQQVLYGAYQLVKERKS